MRSYGYGTIHPATILNMRNIEEMASKAFHSTAEPQQSFQCVFSFPKHWRRSLGFLQAVRNGIRIKYSRVWTSARENKRGIDEFSLDDIFLYEETAPLQASIVTRLHDLCAHVIYHLLARLTNGPLNLSKFSVTRLCETASILLALLYRMIHRQCLKCDVHHFIPSSGSRGGRCQQFRK